MTATVRLSFLYVLLVASYVALCVTNPQNNDFKRVSPKIGTNRNEGAGSNRQNFSVKDKRARDDQEPRAFESPIYLIRKDGLYVYRPEVASIK